ncbi:MAG TPA: hypothetical protein VLV89_00765 [Candidatus Acidoferrum sp.]|nr:hypothetical protein [Candidatus Acidoferrum sp.]
MPETIPVRFTEEDAEYVSVRPIKRQTFRLRELTDMVLSVTDRDLPRIQKIFHSGTIVYHFFRYTWDGFDADAAELAALLAGFPDDFPPGDPRRKFSAETCTAALIESSAVGRQPVEILREAAERKPLFSSHSFWECFITLAAANPDAVTYSGYSFARHADLFGLDLSPEQSAALLKDAARLAPRNLRVAIAALGTLPRIVFVSPRSN